MATTYNFTDGSISGVPKPPEHTPIEDRLFVRRNIIDCSKQTLDAGSADVGQVINIPAGTTVINAWIRVITAETADGTCDLGYGGSVNVWGNALTLDSAAGSILSLAAGSQPAPIHFAAADTIDVVATTDTTDVDLDGAKFEVVALMLKALDTY
jgi:hypothetical protein